MESVIWKGPLQGRDSAAAAAADYNDDDDMETQLVGGVFTVEKGGRGSLTREQERSIGVIELNRM